MRARRQILKSAFTMLALAGFLASCKHWPAGEYDRSAKENRDGGGGDGGGY